MKSGLALILLSAASVPAFAAIPVGQWYSPSKTHSNGEFTPESLTTVEADGTLHWEILFDGHTQKQVVRFKTVWTETTVKTTAIESQTGCNGTTMVVDLVPQSFSATSGMIQLGSVESKLATPAQIQKFANATEGCE